MKISVLTTFPEMLEPVIHAGVLGKAVENNILEIELINIRDFSKNKHHNTDDYPFGGGAGMVMLAQPVFDAFASVKTEKSLSIFMSPQGSQLTAELAKQLSGEEHIIILCGHYEGVDQRVIDNLIDSEVSIGDYVLSGGELAALVVIDAVSRFIPGVLGNSESAENDSFSDGLLDYPQYTRPAEYNGMTVPEVLLNGNHALISAWRREQQLINTKNKRPDLLNTAELSAKDVELLKKI